MRALRNLAKQKRMLADQARRVEQDERRLVRQLAHVLPSLGYRLLTAPAVAPKRLRCPKCPRNFAHPHHLARHVSAMHRRRRRSVGRRKR